MRSLKETFSEWVSPDGAVYEMAKVLGMVSVTEEYSGEHKWVWMTNNPVNDFLYKMLAELALLGVLEKDEDNQFRYVAEFSIDKKAEEISNDY